MYMYGEQVFWVALYGKSGARQEEMNFRVKCALMNFGENFAVWKYYIPKRNLVYVTYDILKLDMA